MKSFLTFKVINTWIFLYFQKALTIKLWQDNQFTTAILFCFIFTAKRRDYNVIVRDSEPIILLESPRSLSVYTKELYYIYINSTSSPCSYSDPIWKMRPGFSETNKRPIVLYQSILMKIYFFCYCPVNKKYTLS